MPPESPQQPGSSGDIRRTHSGDTLATVAKIHRVDVSTPSQSRFIDRCDDEQGQWNPSHDDLLKTWRRQACINLWLQLSSSYYYERLNVWSTYPTIAMSVITSIGTFIGTHIAVRYCMAGLSLLSACLVAMNRHSRAPEKAQDHTIKTREYATFIRFINFILILPPDQRPPMKETLGRLRRDFDRINVTQMEPPIHIIRSYEKNHKSLETSLYEDLNDERRFRPSMEDEETGTTNSE